MTAPRLLDVVSELAQADPTAVALWDGAAAADPAGTTTALPVTRQQLVARSAAIAEVLRGLGVGAGDCVGVWLPNWSDSVAAQFAALGLGAHVIGINTRYNSEEVAHVLQMAAPQAVLMAHDFNDLDLVGRLRAALEPADRPAPALVVVAAPGTPAPDELSAYDLGSPVVALAPSHPATAPTTLPPGPSALAVGFTTSGSTGRPKLAAHDEAGTTEHLLAAGEALRFRPDDVMLGALPLSGVFGFVAAYAAVLAGVPVLLEPVFRASGVVAEMAELGVTHIVGGDDLIGRIADEQRASGARLALRHVLIADFEGRTPELAAWAEQACGAVLTGVYGSSETFALTAFWPTDAPPETRAAGGGHVVTPAIAVRIADPLTNGELPDGEQGELQLRGPNVVDDYLGDPSVKAAAFTSDGWFRTGDLAVRTGEGAFRYVCRMGDVLRLRGFLVDPAEIELRLIAHDAVALAKVVGAPARDGHGTEAIAFVVARPGHTTTSEELRDWCAATLARFKVPAEVRFLDEMPTTSGTNGTKIRAAALRELAATELAATERTPR